MAAKTIELTFEGYWKEQEVGKLPNKPGVYVVYEGVFDWASNSIALIKSIYIGTAENINTAVINHDGWDSWREHCRIGTTICFSFAPVDESDRDRVQAALVYRHKPPANSAGKDEFKYCQTTVQLSGKMACLEEKFTVLQTD